MQISHDWTRAEPEHWRYGGGASDTILHPIVLAAMVVAIIVVLSRPRRFALDAFLFSTFLIPAGQEVLVGGFHIFVYRIIVAAGWIRLVSGQRSRNILAGGWNSLDTAFSLYVFFHVVAFSLLNSTTSAVLNQVGYVWDFAGGYFLLRSLIRNEEDVTRTIKRFAVLVLVFAACMTWEQVSGKNVFGILGGVQLISDVRQGRIRSEAVFQHAILAGVFGSTLMPLFIVLWKTGKAKGLAVLGVIGAAVMAITSAGSTAIAAYAAGVLGICFWPLRRHLRLVRWAIGLTLVGLHIMMKAPVWSLIQRVDVVQGASSYHRYVLVDQFLRHWYQWWLIGTNENAKWGSFAFDTANQYVAEGIGGGLLTLIFFVVQIVWCFGRIGTARIAVERQDRQKAWMYWLLGVALFAHMTAFVGIYYFDQTRVGWFALLAMICAATAVPAESQVKVRLIERDERDTLPDSDASYWYPAGLTHENGRST